MRLAVDFNGAFPETIDARLEAEEPGFRILGQRLIEARSNVRAVLGTQRFDGELSRGQILLPEEALRFALEQLTADQPAITR